MNRRVSGEQSGEQQAYQVGEATSKPMIEADDMDDEQPVNSPKGADLPV